MSFDLISSQLRNPQLSILSHQALTTVSPYVKKLDQTFTLVNLFYTLIGKRTIFKFIVMTIKGKYNVYYSID